MTRQKHDAPFATSLGGWYLISDPNVGADGGVIWDRAVFMSLLCYCHCQRPDLGVTEVQKVSVYAGATIESVLMTENHKVDAPGRPVSA